MKICAVEIRRASLDAEANDPRTGYCAFIQEQGLVPDAQGEPLHATRAEALKAVFARAPDPKRVYVLFNAHAHATLKAA